MTTKSIAANMVLPPLHADVQVRAFQEVAGSSRDVDALKSKLVKLYYQVFQVRCRVRNIWKNMELLWEQMLPEALDSLLPGIGEKELEEVEEKLGCQLPEDLAESFWVHEGKNASGRRQGQFLFEPLVFAIDDK